MPRLGPDALSAGQDFGAFAVSRQLRQRIIESRRPHVPERCGFHRSVLLSGNHGVYRKSGTKGFRWAKSGRYPRLVSGRHPVKRPFAPPPNEDTWASGSWLDDPIERRRDRRGEELVNRGLLLLSCRNARPDPHL